MRQCSKAKCDTACVYNTYLAFFHFEQTNAIAQQLQIFLGSFASNLGSNEFPVKRCIIIIFVWSQIHFFELTRVTILSWTVISIVSFLVLAVVWDLVLGVH